MLSLIRARLFRENCSHHHDKYFSTQMHQISFGGLAPPRTAGELNPLGVVGKSWEQRNGGGGEQKKGRRGKDWEAAHKEKFTKVGACDIAFLF